MSAGDGLKRSQLSARASNAIASSFDITSSSCKSNSLQHQSDLLSKITRGILEGSPGSRHYQVKVLWVPHSDFAELSCWLCLRGKSGHDRKILPLVRCFVLSACNFVEQRAGPNDSVCFRGGGRTVALSSRRLQFTPCFLACGT